MEFRLNNILNVYSYDTVDEDLNKASVALFKTIYRLYHLKQYLFTTIATEERSNCEVCLKVRIELYLGKVQHCILTTFLEAKYSFIPAHSFQLYYFVKEMKYSIVKITALQCINTFRLKYVTKKYLQILILTNCKYDFIWK